MPGTGTRRFTGFFFDESGEGAPLMLARWAESQRFGLPALMLEQRCAPTVQCSHRCKEPIQVTGQHYEREIHKIEQNGGELLLSVVPGRDTGGHE
jgi:hypothetical protein